MTINMHLLQVCSAKNDGMDALNSLADALRRQADRVTRLADEVMNVDETEPTKAADLIEQGVNELLEQHTSEIFKARNSVRRLMFYSGAQSQ